MVNEKMRFVLIYFGRRGGGVGFHQDLYYELENGPNKVSSVTTSDLESSHAIDGEFKVHIKGSKFKLLRSIRIIMQSKAILDYLNNLEDEIFLMFTMLHPADLFLRLLLRVKGKKVISIIHDDRSHSGEYFPPRVIVRIITHLSQTNLYLSEYVAKRNGEDQINRVFDFPKSRTENIHDSNHKDIDILMYGRIKNYKGIDLFARAISEFKKSYKIVIAGSGQSVLPQASQINRWLTDSEIELLLKRSKIVVCPYIEATQSGIVNQAHKFGVPVVVTPVGALPEQINENNGIISKSCQPQDLAEAIETALQKNWTKVEPTKLYGGINYILGKLTI
jgi:glycosyltransferase involved in cell wall biosynthesis